MRPMLATPGTGTPLGQAWAHEVKWDGMRVLVDVRDHQIRITSRTERDVTIAFPELVAHAAGLTDYEDLLLDAEVVVLSGGLPSFAALAERFNVTRASVAQALAAQAPVTLMVFDVLRAAGSDLTGRPLRVRRQVLEGAGLGSDWVRVPPVFDDGEELAAATAEQGVEGLVSKRWDSIYVPGRRSPDWVKTVHRRTGSFVIGGWRPEVGSTGRLGAVLLGSPTPGGLLYRGRIGSGLAGRTGESLLHQLREIACESVPFADDLPTEDRRGAHWVRPEVVVDVEFHGESSGGRLRQPSWRGVRADLTVAELSGEESSQELNQASSQEPGGEQDG